jgi:hypothetical protein
MTLAKCSPDGGPLEGGGSERQTDTWQVLPRSRLDAVIE